MNQRRIFLKKEGSQMIAMNDEKKKKFAKNQMKSS